MVVVKVSGGLGNQMFQYAFGKAIAKKNNEDFQMDLSFYATQSLREFELLKFNINERTIRTESFFDVLGIKKKMQKIYLKFTKQNSFGTYYKEKEATVYDPNVFSLGKEKYFDGYWQNEKYFLEIRECILREFTSKAKFSKEMKKNMSYIKSTSSVSVHIRRGDYVTNGHTHNVHGVCDLGYYKKAIEYFVEKINEPVFFIFSDDMAWCKENFSFVSEKHFVDNTKNAIEDLELMKNCKHNIIANSSFSWWGAWLNESPTKIVISPLRWVVNNPKNHKWVPNKWMQF